MANVLSPAETQFTGFVKRKTVQPPNKMSLSLKCIHNKILNTIINDAWIKADSKTGQIYHNGLNG